MKFNNSIRQNGPKRDFHFFSILRDFSVVKGLKSSFWRNVFMSNQHLLGPYDFFLSLKSLLQRRTYVKCIKLLKTTSIIHPKSKPKTHKCTVKQHYFMTLYVLLTHLQWPQRPNVVMFELVLTCKNFWDEKNFSQVLCHVSCYWPQLISLSFRVRRQMPVKIICGWGMNFQTQAYF